MATPTTLTNRVAELEQRLVTAGLQAADIARWKASTLAHSAARDALTQMPKNSDLRGAYRLRSDDHDRLLDELDIRTLLAS
jgi:hypothetical protein